MVGIEFIYKVNELHISFSFDNMLACRLEGIFLKKFPQDSFKIPSRLHLFFSLKSESEKNNCCDRI